jgi:hypothetical protein
MISPFELPPWPALSSAHSCDVRCRTNVLTLPMRVVLPVRRPSSRRPLISVLHFLHSLRSPVVYRRLLPPRIRGNHQLCFFEMGYTVPSSLGDGDQRRVAHNSGKDFYPGCNAGSWHLLAKAAGSTALASRRAGTQSWEQICPLLINHYGACRSSPPARP